jgi:DNA-binding NarL/FixJ family response regulator
MLDTSFMACGECASSAETGYRVVVVEDNARDRAEVLNALNGSEFHVVAEAESLGEARQLLALPAPDLALVDMHLPDGLGYTFLAAARERWGVATTLMVLSSFGDKVSFGQAIAHGAQGYMTKGAGPELIRARLNKVLREGFCFGPNVARMIFEASTASGAQPQGESGRQEALTEAEKRVLGLMARGLSNPDMARELGVKPGTVKTHVAAILGKTSAPNRLVAVNQARALGWLSE